MGMLIGNAVSGHFVVQEGDAYPWYGEVEGELKANGGGLHVRMWLQGGRLVEHADDHPYAKARRKFLTDHRRESALTMFVGAVDPAHGKDLRCLSAERLEESLAGEDGESIREFLLGLQPVEGSDFRIDFGGKFGEIIAELRKKPMIPVR